MVVFDLRDGPLVAVHHERLHVVAPAFYSRFSSEIESSDWRTVLHVGKLAL
jgi:hypothetical protein